MASSSQSRREFLKRTSVTVAALGAAGMLRRVFGDGWETKPNIVVFMCENVSPFLHCYGDPNGSTPTLDSFAEQSVVYTNAFTVFGVCAPSRASLWSGMSATTIGAQHMRCSAHLPAELVSWPALLRESGYETIRADKGDSRGAEKGNLWSAVGAYWWDRKPLPGWRDYDGSKPFFYQHGYGATHEGHLYHPHTDDTTSRETLPAYLPDTPTAHKMMNTMYEKYREMDDEFKMVLDALHSDGLDDDTIVIFTSDHGCGLSRMKRWPYDSGTRVPFVVRFPEKNRRPGRDLPGTTCDDLISFLDLGPTFLHCAGVAAPSYMEGQPVLGPRLPSPREYVFTARGRIDERYDFVRSARDGRYRYVRNFMPWLPWYQWVAAAEGTQMMRELRGTHEQGTLRAEADQFFAPTRPREELYDTIPCTTRTKSTTSRIPKTTARCCCECAPRWPTG